MPRLALQIKATLEGVASLQPQPGRLWHMKTKCENCGESSEHPMTASTSEVRPPCRKCEPRVTTQQRGGASAIRCDTSNPSHTETPHSRAPCLQEVEIDGSRGKAHLTYKCKTCNRQGSITIEEEKHEYTACVANAAWPCARIASRSAALGWKLAAPHLAHVTAAHLHLCGTFMHAPSDHPSENAAASEFATIMELDARGMTPIEFSFMNGWIAKGGGDSSATFDDVDLTEGEWAEYDEDADASLTIMDLESRFEAAEKHKHGSRRKK